MSTIYLNDYSVIIQLFGYLITLILAYMAYTNFSARSEAKKFIKNIKKKRGLLFSNKLLRWISTEAHYLRVLKLERNPLTLKYYIVSEKDKDVISFLINSEELEFKSKGSDSKGEFYSFDFSKEWLAKEKKKSS